MNLREQTSSADETSDSDLYSNAWSTTETIFNDDLTQSVHSTLEDKTALADAFAAANSKRNIDFHKLFPQVPAMDHLIEGIAAFAPSLRFKGLIASNALQNMDVLSVNKYCSMVACISLFITFLSIQISLDGSLM